MIKQFRINLRKKICWSWISFFAGSTLAKSTVIVPVVGYAILISDEFAEILSSNRIDVYLCIASIQTRLTFVYFGLIFIFVAYFAWWLLCPKLIKRHRDAEGFILEEWNIMSIFRLNNYATKFVDHYKEDDLTPIRDRENAINLAKSYREKSLTAGDWERHRPYINNLLENYYHCRDHENKNQSTCIFCVFAVGVGILAIPSVDVFLGVSKSVIYSIKASFVG